MTATDTTIKVPRALRDRISRRAKREHTTLAAAIERALDEAEELEFWREVRRHNAELSADERRAHTVDGALGDDLADPDDDALTAEDAW
jgi:predicted transcriptional regulator